ncbi:MAG: immunoglobulin domain-containing protein, partial [Pseudomonadota bacterium]
TVQFPGEYVGAYFFADYCSGRIRRLNPSNASVTDFATVKWPVNMLVGPDGSLYYFSFFDGKLSRIRYNNTNQPPQIATHPATQTVAAGQPATFTVSASGTPPFSYQWQRNGTNIGGATAATYTIAATAAGDNGAKLRCVVGNSFGSATSNEATLTVTSNQPPVAAITTPAAGASYQAGQTLNYAGTGTDPETGNLPASAFTWRVDFHHDDHFHPFVPPTSGVATGSAVIPTIGETSANVWYRIHLTVTDPSGLSHSVFRDVFPQVSTITLQTNPPGLALTLDGAPATAPVAVQSVAGIIREVGTVSPQNMGGTNYMFGSWSDGGAATRAISTPATNTAYTADFVTCSYTIAPSGQTVAAAGGTGTTSVTAAPGCAWTATGNDAWIAITAGATGSGNGSVSFSVAANAGALRTGTITIAGQAFTVTQ